jgi:hypothetical protein
MKDVKSAATVAAGVVTPVVPSPSAMALEKKMTTATTFKWPVADKMGHQILLRVNTHEPAMMNRALNNAMNVARRFTGQGAHQGDQADQVGNFP